MSYTLSSDTGPSSIVLYTGNDDEMLRITRDGFYVRGVKVPQDDKEAESVYNAFRAWMTWANMTRNY
jgi:hypothetical protein